MKNTSFLLFKKTLKKLKCPKSFYGGAKGEAVELDGFPFNKRVAVLPV